MSVDNKPTFQPGDKVYISKLGPLEIELNNLKIGDTLTIEYVQKRGSIIGQSEFSDGYIYFMKDHTYGYGSAYIWIWIRVHKTL